MKCPHCQTENVNPGNCFRCHKPMEEKMGKKRETVTVPEVKPERQPRRVMTAEGMGEINKLRDIVDATRNNVDAALQISLKVKAPGTDVMLKQLMLIKGKLHIISDDCGKRQLQFDATTEKNAAKAAELKAEYERLMGTGIDGDAGEGESK